MKIVVLPSACHDLSAGFDFYERQREGLGDYFIESLASDVDSLRFTPASTSKFLVITGFYPSVFHMRFI
jgi:hypothetical protein